MGCFFIKERFAPFLVAVTICMKFSPYVNSCQIASFLLGHKFVTVRHCLLLGRDGHDGTKAVR